MTNMMQRILALVGAGLLAGVLFLLATVGIVVALIVFAVVFLVMMVMMRGKISKSNGQFIVFTSQQGFSSPKVEPKTPIDDKGKVLYDLSPDEYTARDSKPPVE